LDLGLEKKKGEVVHGKINKSTTWVSYKWPITLANNAVPCDAIHCIKLLKKKRKRKQKRGKGLMNNSSAKTSLYMLICKDRIAKKIGRGEKVQVN
jgi:hypothetical protein